MGPVYCLFGLLCVDGQSVSGLRFMQEALLNTCCSDMYNTQVTAGIDTWWSQVGLEGFFEVNLVIV